MEDALNDEIRGGNDNGCGQGCVEKHVQEVLVIVKTDAVSHPRAVVIHLQNALVALGTVMASVRLLIND